jgi:hypothetical protein
LTSQERTFIRLIAGFVFLAAAAFAIRAAILTHSEKERDPAWSYTDLRALDPALAVSPATDLIALYTRIFEQDFQIRLEFLDMSLEKDFDLYLAFDLGPGGRRDLPIAAETGFDWNVLASIPAQGPIQIVNSQTEDLADLKLRTWRDPSMDILIVSLNQQGLADGQEKLDIQVFVTPAGSQQLADSMGPVQAGQQAGPPPARAPVLLAFWDLFKASTPSQALQQWDGAHSGPASERHGLKHLLRAVENYGTPVALLDLKRPAALSALDYMDALADIQRLEESNLIFLPDYVSALTPPSEHPFPPPASVTTRLWMDIRQAGAGFGFAQSPFFYLPNRSKAPDEAPYLDNYRFYFFRTPEAAAFETAFLPQTGIPGPACCRLESQSSNILLRLPSHTTTSIDASSEESDWQASSEGPSVELRRALLQAALNGGQDLYREGSIVFLGGSFPETTWGVPSAAENTLRYLASRPWIWFLDESDLLSSSITSKNPSLTVDGIGGFSGDELFDSIISEEHRRLLVGLGSVPEGVIADQAWWVYQSFFEPAFPESVELYHLRANYLGQIWHLLEAARWADDPPAYGSRSNCSVDLDMDGEPECVLASENFFAVLEPYGGYLSLAFAAIGGDIHQVVAPSSHFLVGMSAPTAWDPTQGIAGDPMHLRGAFSDFPGVALNPNWDLAQIETAPGMIRFEYPDNGLRKLFMLEPTGILVLYETDFPLRIQIPLAVDPWNRFSSGWGESYIDERHDQKWRWGIEGFQVELSTSGRLSTHSFNASYEALLEPENPNYNYPRGHYLPLGMGLAEIRAENVFWVRLTFSDLESVR